MSEIDDELERLTNEEEELVDYYGIEQEKKKRPARKIVPKEQEKTRSLRMKRYKEHSLARYSNIYMIAGLIIGVAIFYFLVSPELKNDYNEKIRELRTSYNKTLSTKNSEIENLRLEVDSLTQKNDEYAISQAEMQKNIDNLTNEVETLKQDIENGGLQVAAQAQAQAQTPASPGDATASNGVAVKNAAAERNNANVIGISGASIEKMIANE